jgi:hypothetical protein
MQNRWITNREASQYASSGQECRACHHGNAESGSEGRWVLIVVPRNTRDQRQDCNG